MINIAEQTALQRETLGKTTPTIQMTAKDTPTTAQCDIQW